MNQSLLSIETQLFFSQRRIGLNAPLSRFQTTAGDIKLLITLLHVLFILVLKGLTLTAQAQTFFIALSYRREFRRSMTDRINRCLHRKIRCRLNVLRESRSW